MIIQPARIVIIDNEQSHLNALTNALTIVGSACLPFHYKEDHPTNLQLAGARFIFCDLHLISDAITSDKKQQYSNIASILLGSLMPDHGPYVLIIWSEFPDEFEDLKPYLEELDAGLRPIDCLCLNKKNFINIDDGVAIPGTNLQAEIAGVLKSKPGLLAMLQWEQNVSKAASATTSKLWELSTSSDADHPDVSLQNTLGKLAKGALGDTAAHEYPGRGVTESLVPLLADQIGKSEINEDLWKGAVSFQYPKIAASPAALYASLHIEYPTAHQGSERGAVSELPMDWVDDEAFSETFGATKEDVLNSFGFRKNAVLKRAIESVSWYFIQINAACDDAQDNPGMLPFCLAAMIPSEIEHQTPKGGVWRSEELSIEEKNCFLFCHGRFVLGMTQTGVKKFRAKYRIRAQLLDLLVQNIRTNAARLGVIVPY